MEPPRYKVTQMGFGNVETDRQVVVVLWGFDGAGPFRLLEAVVCACLRGLNHRTGSSLSDQRTVSMAYTVVIRELSRNGRSRTAVGSSLI